MFSSFLKQSDCMAFKDIKNECFFNVFLERDSPSPHPLLLYEACRSNIFQNMFLFNFFAPNNKKVIQVMRVKKCIQNFQLWSNNPFKGHPPIRRQHHHLKYFVMSYSLITHNPLESFVNHRRLIIVISCSSPAKRHRCFGNNPLKNIYTHLTLHTIDGNTLERTSAGQADEKAC